MRARLTRLRIAGFKSFADAASIEILPGLTGIVGPNGCGKSNVVEALRWTMGESSARSLRGGEMDDLIFAGTVGRPSRNLAEVTLTLEDAAGLAPPPHDQPELQVSRQIERGAGNGYRINGREVLAREVQTLFADLASGARSSAMVSQGRVAAIVAARPEERRSVLEEAAGITGLHARRHEAELKLRAAEANLARAEDLRQQLAARLQELAVQATQAARYREIGSGLREAEAGLLALLHARARRAVRQTLAAVAGAHTTLREMEHRARRAATDEQQAQAAVAHPLAAEAEARGALERQRIASAVLEREQARAAADADASLRRLEQASGDAEAAAARLQDACAALARIVAEQQAANMRRSTLPARLQAAEQALGEAQRARAEADARVSDASAREIAARAQAGQIATDRDAAALRAARLRDELALLEQERTAASQALPRQETLDALRAACLRADRTLQAAREQAEQAGEARIRSARDADAARLRADEAQRVAASAMQAGQDARARLRQLAAALATLEQQAGEADRARTPDAERAAALDHVARCDAALVDARTAVAKAAEDHAVARESHEQARHAAAAAGRRRQQIAQAIDAAEASLAAEAALTEAQPELAEAQATLADASRSLAEADAARLGAEQDAAAAQHRLAGALAAQARIEAEIDGLSRAAGSVAQTGPDPRWPHLAQTLPVPPGLELAVAAVLADGLRAALDEAAPRHWRTLGAIADQQLPAGCIALSSLIEAPAALVRILSHAGLVGEAGGERQQPQLTPGQCLVARDGRLWRWDGFCIAAAGAENAGAELLVRRRLTEAAAEGAAAAGLAAESSERAAASAEILQAHAQRATQARDGRDAAERTLLERRERLAALAAHHAGALARLHALLEQDAPVRSEVAATLAILRAEPAALPDHQAANHAAELRESEAAAAASRARQAQQAAEGALHCARGQHSAMLSRHGEAESRLAALLPQRRRLAEEHAAVQAEVLRTGEACAALPDPAAAIAARDRAEGDAELAQVRDTEARAARREAERRCDGATAEHAEAVAVLGRQRSRLEALLPRLEATRIQAAEAVALHASLRQQAAALPDPARIASEAAAARDVLARASEQETQCRELRAQRAAEAASLDETCDRLAASHADWARAESSARQDHEAAEARRMAEKRAHVVLVEAPSQCERRLGEQAQALAQAQSTFASAKSDLDAATQALAQAQATRHRADSALSEARQDELRLQGRAEQAQAILTQLLAETPQPPQTDPDDLSETAEAALRRRTARLAREREEIGPVNLRAEIESDEAQSRAEALLGECQELNTAIARLRGSIGHLNGEGRARLLAVFNAVDGHFQALFTRMFGGGRAQLGMVGGDDPLETGLEIYAQPPGKKLATLSLLSGGEQALCALSLIFAVFRCNPAPVCVLDEVDAPLDDANVARFAALLGDMVAQTGTRFLIVTHHQLTMAHMDRLYGVTMQERGVSRVLSVDLAAATDMATPARAQA